MSPGTFARENVPGRPAMGVTRGGGGAARDAGSGSTEVGWDGGWDATLYGAIHVLWVCQLLLYWSTIRCMYSTCMELQPIQYFVGLLSRFLSEVYFGDS